MIYKLSEWQSATGNWHCACIDNLKENSGAWYMNARAMKISPADFLEVLLNKYKPDNFYFDPDTCFCSYSWKSQTAMRKFKNEINAIARTNKFEI